MVAKKNTSKKTTVKSVKKNSAVKASVNAKPEMKKECDCKCCDHAYGCNCALSCRCGCFKRALIFEAIIILATVFITLAFVGTGCQKHKPDFSSPKCEKMKEGQPCPCAKKYDDRKDNRKGWWKKGSKDEKKAKAPIALVPAPEK